VQPIAAILSFRLGGTDGVSVEAEKWSAALQQLGFEVRRVAGEISGTGRPGDVVVPWLAIDAFEAPAADDLAQALAGSGLVVVENLCSLPLNERAAQTAANLLATFVETGGRVLFHHHDLPWQRPATSHLRGFPPALDALHVTINDLSRVELAARGIEAVVIRNCFDLDARPGDRDSTRRQFGFRSEELVVLHPARAIPRKNVPVALRFAEDLDGRVGARPTRYWLTGPAEDGYGPTLDSLLAAAEVPCSFGLAPRPIDAYAAADVIVFPSTWEGFGNPLIESVIARRPLAAAPYPVLAEIEELGFRFFAVDDPDPLIAWLDDSDDAVFAHNLVVARRHCSLADLPARLTAACSTRGWAW
jgi:glycosyltransferase involved in cell wall biosynthesis